jgi:NAD(P)-dependent dehydrogenase (short-subunit alcohol dehydrogenase family)
VTGGNAGIGFEVALQLAAKGARVLVAARNAGRVDAAVKRLQAAHPKASVAGYTLDLAAFRRVASGVSVALTKRAHGCAPPLAPLQRSIHRVLEPDGMNDRVSS